MHLSPTSKLGYLSFNLVPGMGSLVTGKKSRVNIEEQIIQKFTLDCAVIEVKFEVIRQVCLHGNTTCFCSYKFI